MPGSGGRSTRALKSPRIPTCPRTSWQCSVEIGEMALAPFSGILGRLVLGILGLFGIFLFSPTLSPYESPSHRHPLPDRGDHRVPASLLDRPSDSGFRAPAHSFDRRPQEFRDRDPARCHPCSGGALREDAPA